MKTIELTAQDLEFTWAGMPCNDGDAKLVGAGEDGIWLEGPFNFGFANGIESITATESDYLNYTIGKVVKLSGMDRMQAKYGGVLSIKCETSVTWGTRLLVRVIEGHTGMTGVVYHDKLAQIIADKTYRFVDGKAVESEGES